MRRIDMPPTASASRHPARRWRRTCLVALSVALVGASGPWAVAGDDDDPLDTVFDLLRDVSETVLPRGACPEPVDLPGNDNGDNDNGDGGGIVAQPHAPVGPVAPEAFDAMVADAHWYEIARGVNFDGSIWVVCYPAGLHPAPHVQERADIIAEEAVLSYDTMIGSSRAGCAGDPNPDPANWGYEIADPDCVLHIFYSESQDCIACVRAAYEVQVFLNPYFKEALQALGFYLNPLVHDFRKVARIVMFHEFFHSIQYATNELYPREINEDRWLVYSEGQARFLQTIVEPDVEYDPTSLFYGTTDIWHSQLGSSSNGVNNFMMRTDRSMCDHSYDYALFWGYLYWKNGGVDTMRLALEEMASFAENEDHRPACNQDLPAAIDAAVRALDGEDESLEEALVNFAVHVFTRDFRWGRTDGSDVRQWGDYLVPARRATARPGVTTHSVGAWGMQYTTIPLAGTVTVSFALPGTGNNPDEWETRLFLVGSDDTLEIRPIAPGEEVILEAGDYVDAVFQPVRLFHRAGSYQISVEIDAGV